MTAILVYDAACAAIAEAKTVDEVSTWIDKAAAVKEYGRRINNRQIEIDAIEIRVQAKRRRGEILAEMKERGQIRRGQPKKVLSGEDDVSFTLEDLGVSRDESSEDQRLAAIPRDSFERLVARCREYAEGHPEKHSFDVLGENAATDKKAARETRERILGGIQMALPDKKFGVILADPEWRFKTYSRDTGMDRAADNHYPTSETDAICARPVGDIAADDCVLFLWATAPMLPDALRVLAAWGFTYKSHAIWKKDRIGTGYWLRNQHELLLIGTRGKIPAPAMGTQFPSVIDAPLGKHSEKPDAFYELIEAYFPTLPKIELNARRARPGWEAWGNEAPVEPAAELPPHHLETGEVIEAPDVARETFFAAECDRIGIPAAGEIVLSAAASPIGDPLEVIDLPVELGEFERLKAVSDFCYPRRLEILADIVPSLVVDGLARSVAGGKDWQLSDAGRARLLELAALQPKPKPKSRLDHADKFQAELTDDEFVEWRALAQLASGIDISGEDARGLIGSGYAYMLGDDRVALTDSGQRWLRSIEQHVERIARRDGGTIGVELAPPAPFQVDLEDVLAADVPPAPLDLPLFLASRES